MSPCGAMVIARTRARRCGRLPGCWAPRSPDGRGSRMPDSGPSGWKTVPPSGFPHLSNRRISPILPAPAAILERECAELTFTLQRLPAPPETTHQRLLAGVPLEPHAVRMGVAEIRRGAPEQRLRRTLTVQIWWNPSPSEDRRPRAASQSVTGHGPASRRSRTEPGGRHRGRICWIYPDSRQPLGFCWRDRARADNAVARGISPKTSPHRLPNRTTATLPQHQSPTSPAESASSAGDLRRPSRN